MVRCFFSFAKSDLSNIFMFLALHKLSFCGFAICGITYMFMSTWLFDLSGRRRTSPLVSQNSAFFFCDTFISGRTLIPIQIALLLTFYCVSRTCALLFLPTQHLLRDGNLHAFRALRVWCYHLQYSFPRNTLFRFPRVRFIIFETKNNSCNAAFYSKALS